MNNVPARVGVALLSTARIVSKQTVAFSVAVVNLSDEEFDVTFASGAQYDFTIYDGGGNKIWRWSEAQPPPTGIPISIHIKKQGFYVLGPTNALDVVSLLPAGSKMFKITGTILSNSFPAEASLDITVANA